MNVKMRIALGGCDSRDADFDVNNAQELADIIKKKLSYFMTEHGVLVYMGFGKAYVEISLKDMERVTFLRLAYNGRKYTEIKSCYPIRLENWVDYIVKLYEKEVKQEPTELEKRTNYVKELCKINEKEKQNE